MADNLSVQADTSVVPADAAVATFRVKAGLAQMLKVRVLMGMAVCRAAAPSNNRLVNFAAGRAAADSRVHRAA